MSEPNPETSSLSDEFKLLVISEEYKDEIRTPHERTELVVEKLIAIGTELSNNTYYDYTAAGMANIDFNNHALALLGEITELSQIEVKIRGNGVRVPDVVLTGVQDESDGVVTEGIAAVFPRDKPMRNLEDPESDMSYIQGVYSTVLDVNRDGSEFKIQPNLVMALRHQQRMNVPLQSTSINLFSVTTNMCALASLDGTATFSIPELEEVRDRNRIYENIAHFGLSHSILMKQINKLKQILHSEVDNNYSQLKKLEILQSIGRLAGHESLRSEAHADLMSELILDVIGEGRTVRITMVERLTEDIVTETRVLGIVMGITMPDSQNVNSVPSIVINEIDVHTNTAEGKIVNFNDIKGFEF